MIRIDTKIIVETRERAAAATTKDAAPIHTHNTCYYYSVLINKLDVLKLRIFFSDIISTLILLKPSKQEVSVLCLGHLNAGTALR